MGEVDNARIHFLLLWNFLSDPGVWHSIAA